MNSLKNVLDKSALFFARILYALRRRGLVAAPGGYALEVGERDLGKRNRREVKVLRQAVPI